MCNFSVTTRGNFSSPKSKEGGQEVGWRQGEVREGLPIEGLKASVILGEGGSRPAVPYVTGPYK